VGLPLWGTRPDPAQILTDRSHDLSIPRHNGEGQVVHTDIADNAVAFHKRLYGCSDLGRPVGQGPVRSGDNSLALARLLFIFHILENQASNNPLNPSA
jgi:hypothetical protein